MKSLNRLISVKFFVSCCLLQLTILSGLLGETQMCSAVEIILDEAPIVASDSNGKVNTLDLFSEDRSLGGVNTSPVLLKEGKITYGEYHINYLDPDAETPLVWPLATDREKWDLYFIRFPFTLNPTPRNRHYKEVTFHVSLKDESATAFDLYPKDVKAREEVEKTVGIAPEGKFKDVGLKLGDYSSTVKFTRLRPEIAAFGEGEHAFYWIYSGTNTGGVSPGTKHALIILKVPHGMRKVAGEIFYEAIMLKDWLGEWLPVEANSAKAPFVWELPIPSISQK